MAQGFLSLLFCFVPHRAHYRFGPYSHSIVATGISTDDPVAYVREKEPSCPLEITEEDGAIVISAERSGGLVYGGMMEG